MAELREQEGVAARALEFLILTAARTGEVHRRPLGRVQLCRAALDGAGRAHEGRQGTSRAAVGAALAILEKMAVDARRRVRVPRRKAGRPLSNMSLLMLLAPHGPRRPDGARLPLDVQRLGRRPDGFPERR